MKLCVVGQMNDFYVFVLNFFWMSLLYDPLPGKGRSLTSFITTFVFYVRIVFFLSVLGKSSSVVKELIYSVCCSGNVKTSIVHLSKLVH